MIVNRGDELTPVTFSCHTLAAKKKDSRSAKALFTLPLDLEEGEGEHSQHIYLFIFDFHSYPPNK